MIGGKHVDQGIRVLGKDVRQRKQKARPGVAGSGLFDDGARQFVRSEKDAVSSTDDGHDMAGLNELAGPIDGVFQHGAISVESAVLLGIRMAELAPDPMTHSLPFASSQHDCPVGHDRFSFGFVMQTRWIRSGELEAAVPDA